LGSPYNNAFVYAISNVLTIIMAPGEVELHSTGIVGKECGVAVQIPIPNGRRDLKNCEAQPIT
jgi:hypothetical protein